MHLDPAFLAFVAERATPEDRARFAPFLKAEAERLAFEWRTCAREQCDGQPHAGLERVHARPEQIAPEGDWLIFFLCTGRRWGKTLAAAQWLRRRALSEQGTYAIVAPTYGDTRDVCVEGGIRGGAVNRRSGFLSVCAPGEVANYNRSIGELRMVNGSKIKLLSADEPDRARGWGFNAAWCDEFSSWRRPETWYETLLPAVTLSDRHRFMITTTPKPNRLSRELILRAPTDPAIVLRRGSTRDNEANLGAGAIDQLREQMTARQSRQEIEGELLLDVEGALWSYDLIDRHRDRDVPAEARTVVAVDPSGGHGATNDEQGIIVASGSHEAAWIVADLSCKLTPDGWGRRAVQGALDHEADLIVYEPNFGGEMVELVLRSIMRDMGVTIRTKAVVSSKGKRLRAEPVVAHYEQGRVHHAGVFHALEDQMTEWVPGLPGERSPDRLDAAVFALTELMEPPRAQGWFLGDLDTRTIIASSDRPDAPIEGPAPTEVVTSWSTNTPYGV